MFLTLAIISPFTRKHVHTMIEEEEGGEGKLVVPPVLHRQSVTNTLDHDGDGMGKDLFRPTD